LSIVQALDKLALAILVSPTANKLITTPEQRAAAYEAMNIRDDG